MSPGRTRLKQGPGAGGASRVGPGLGAPSARPGGCPERAMQAKWAMVAKAKSWGSPGGHLIPPRQDPQTPQGKVSLKQDLE